MSRKIIVFLLVAALSLLSIPAVALAAGTTAIGGVNYDTTDYTVIHNFLLQDSGTPGKKNWEALGFASADDPATWSVAATPLKVVWDSHVDPRRAIEVDFEGIPVAGSINVSSMDALEYLTVSDTDISGINVAGCSAMIQLVANTMPNLTALDVSGLSMMTMLKCQQDPNLTTLNVSGCAALKNLYCDHSAIQTLDASGLTTLDQLNCHYNALTSLNIGGDTALTSVSCSNNSGLASITVSGAGSSTSFTLQCEHTGLTSLDLTGSLVTALFCDSGSLTSLTAGSGSKLVSVNCSGNQITMLDLSGASDLRSLDCSNNKLTSLNLILNTKLRTLVTAGNQLISINATFDFTPNPSSSVSLAATGNGYLELYSQMGSFYATAVPKAGETFHGWNDGSSTVSTTAKIDLTPGTNYSMVAAFSGGLTLTTSPASGKIYTGGRITITPSIPGGTWDFDESLLSRSGNVFTGLKVGTAHVRYVSPDEQSATVDVVISKAALPTTGQDFTPALLLLALAALSACAALAPAMRRKRARN